MPNQYGDRIPMPRHDGLPKPVPSSIRKIQLLQSLQTVDNDIEARARVLTLETEFRRRIGIHVGSLPTSDAVFAKFNTNPFVLMIHSRNKGYRNISQIENDILPAKVFSRWKHRQAGWSRPLFCRYTAGKLFPAKCIPQIPFLTVGRRWGMCSPWLR
jgi:hypothetical protein